MVDPVADLARLDGVPAAVAAARDAIDAVLRNRGPTRITAEQVTTALLDGARASAELSGERARWLPGTVRLSTELVALSSQIRVAPGQAMARAHLLLAHGAVPQVSLGRLRSDDAVSERMVALGRLLTSPTRASAVVLAAVVHAELATVAPFGTADELLARAVEHMVLIESGVDPRAVIVVEAGHLRSGRDYGRRLMAYRDGGVLGVRDWLVHCTRALAYGAEVSPLQPRAESNVAKQAGAEITPDMTRRP
ncbi:MAG TPA: oxidoreductase [Propionibacteriaceae bacterium]|nr:oxidoreductase [Propionibacteriaceae bacterium]